MPVLKSIFFVCPFFLANELSTFVKQTVNDMDADQQGAFNECDASMSYWEHNVTSVDMNTTTSNLL